MEEEFKQRSTRLRADLEEEKRNWEVERERQAQQLAKERKVQTQDLAAERQKLEERLAARQADLVRQRELESAALREEWEHKQDEWLAEHQAALQKSEKGLTLKLHEAETQLEDRK